FEKMFFIFLEPVAGSAADALESASDCYHAAIGYAVDARETSVNFYLTEPLAWQMTGNFMGIDISSLDEGQVLDTLRETANMAVGSLLGEINPEGTAVLGMPESGKVIDFSEKLFDDQSFITFRTSSGVLCMIIE
ncbi:MAG: chemotaxis protein CheX, partial [Desulfobulbaceae bacterium]|nr:chemotaxis protein CheX [Desulfobulbaceae bacterium]